MDSASSSSSNFIKSSQGGRSPKEVWNYIIKGQTKDHGHYSAKCECGKSWTCGKPKKLENHLATKCSKVDIETKQKFLRIVALRKHTKDNKIDYPASKKT
ncbi:21725_t:CDS:1, partial [Cetraspora pellucida]